MAELKAKETDQGTALYSRSQSTKEVYDNRIDALFNGEPAGRIGAIALDRSDVLDMLGYGNVPVHIAEGKVIAGKFNHGLTAEHWKKIPEWLDNPAAVFDSDTVPGRLVFIAPELVNGTPVRMIVEPNGDELDVHLLVNAYDAKGNSPTRRWIDEGLLRYLDKAKSRQFLATSGLQLPRVLQSTIGSNQKIYSEGDLVKYRKANEQYSKSTDNVTNPHTIQSLQPALINAFTGKLQRAVSALFEAGKARVVTAEQAAMVIGKDALFAENDLQSEYEVPNPSRQPRPTPIDGSALAELRRAAAGIESPDKGITVRRKILILLSGIKSRQAVNLLIQGVE